MNLFSELQTAVQYDLNVGSESTLYTPTIIKLAINRAYTKASALFRWPETEDAQKTSSQSNIEYYDYPQDFRPDSIWKLTVDGVDYGDPLSFKDYMYEVENDLPSGLEKKWTSQWRRYFIYPTPATATSNNIVVWGQRNVDTLVNDADITIWSYSMPECNEAIVLEAAGILKSKGEEEQAGMFRSQEAKQILAVAWGKVRQDKAKYHKTQSMFTTVDFYGRSNSSSNIGRF